MKYYSIFVLFILLIPVLLLADNDKTVTNSMLLEKIELYQKMNDTRFEVIFNEIRELREDMSGLN